MEAIKAENLSLNEQLSDKDNAIEQKIRQIKLLLSKGRLSDAEFKKAKEEILNLRNQIEDYKTKIAELTLKNEELTAENLGLTENLSIEQSKSAEKDKAIESRDKTIGVAKRLHASSISASGVRERKLFGKKEVTTDKAGKVEEIRIQFSVDKNAFYL